MDISGDWEPGEAERRVWTQGPWHGSPADPGTGYQGTGHQGNWVGAGFGDGLMAGDWTVSTQAVSRLRRRIVRLLTTAALAGLALVAGLIALAVAVFPHGGLLAVLGVLLVVPILLVALATVVALWAARWAWRSGAWLEAAPAAAGMPWLSRVVRAARALLAGRAFWRLGRRARRARRLRYQPRTGDLSGTTR